MLEDKEIQREKLILNMSVEGFWDWDLQTDQFYLSPSFCERIGYSSVTTLFDIHFIKMIIHPDDHQKIASLIDKVVYEKQETAIVSCRIISKDGSVHWFESRCGIVACNEDGIASRMVGTLIDITRQKQMESELQRLTGTLLAISNCNQVLQSEARYRSLFENKHTVMLIIDPENGSILDANPAAVIYYGWKRDELCNMNISQINMLNKAEIQAEMQLALAEKRNFFLFRHLLRDSSVRDVEVVSGPISIKGKSLLYSIITDITERKQAEQELRQSEERFRKLFQSHAVVNILLDPDTGNIVDANPSAADFYGWSVDELKQMNIRQINPISVKEIKKNLEKSRLSKQNKFQFLHGRSDGSLRDVEVFSSKIEIAGKELLYVTVFDVTHKKLAEEALRESERKFRTITEQIAEMVFVTDTKGVLTYVSQAVERIFDYTAKEVTGHLFTEYLNEEEISGAIVIFNEILLHEETHHLLNFKFRKKNGLFFFGEVHVTYYQDQEFSGMIGLIQDITERKREEEERQQLEAHLRKSQRLETIGTLAGGIAHDFNNILMPILGYAEMGVMNLPKEDPIYQYFSEIRLAAERAKQLVSQIMTFSKVQESEPAVVSVQTVISEALSLIRPLIPATIIIEQHFETCRNILVDSSKLHQVILNLCINAFHTMEQSGGVLKIEVREIIPDSHMQKLFPNLDADRYAQISISDTGCGMDETILEHIFEPFFTTKPTNKGTGLGLSVVYGIIKSFQGEITVESQPGKGSRFSIYLPVINDKTLKAIEDKSCANGRGSGTILLVDDEEATLKMMRLMITQLGFKITALNSPEQALTLFMEHPEQFDLVITDQTMPIMTGVEMAEKIHKIKPKLPIILMTGYDKNANDLLSLNQFGIRKILKKPLKMKEIALIINELTAHVSGL
ncbi:MAG: PAS domain S-box protein [Chlorobium sp.]|nr:PAS domain S-box protein [Chlorobium sp.]